MKTMFYSYIPLLVETLKKHKPKRILEFGTGLSTTIMKIVCPNCYIKSIEPSLFWFLYYKWQYKYLKNIDIIYSKRTKIKGDFDLIFIDSHKRVECFKNNKAKVVLLHDFNRYKNDIKTDVIKNNTGLMLSK